MYLNLDLLVVIRALLWSVSDPGLLSVPLVGGFVKYSTSVARNNILQYCSPAGDFVQKAGTTDQKQIAHD